MKLFQTGVIIAFVIFALIAVFVFATFSGRDSESVGAVAVWGTLPKDVFNDVLKGAAESRDGYNSVTYREVAESGFVPTLVEAIAAGQGPDLVLLPSDALIAEADKLIPVSYRTVSRRTFQDSFVEAGEVFLTDDGILGLPFSVDPFVTYWNRTLFSASGIARPARYWDELVDIAPALSRATTAGTLTQSAVALGEWGNVAYAKDIFISLITGLGNPIIEPDGSGGYRTTLVSSGSATPAESALRFYTEFSDPNRQVYSWNRSLPDSRSAFLAGTLAIYLAPASEAFTLRAANPNLNFDVAAYPEVRGGTRAVPARLSAFSVPRGSQNPRGALMVALLLSGADAQTRLVEATGLPSVRRDVLSSQPENPYESVFRDAALNAFSFRDPSPAATDDIFKRMVENVSSGRLRITEAAQSAQTELEALLR